MRDKYQQAKFEQYSEQLGYGDFEEGEPDDDGRTRYRNPNTQGRWNFWVASRDALALQTSASAEPVQAVVWALKFPGDGGRLCLSTMFDTEEEAKEYAGRCESAEVVPLAPPPVTAAREQEASTEDQAVYASIAANYAKSLTSTGTANLLEMVALYGHACSLQDDEEATRLYDEIDACMNNRQPEASATGAEPTDDDIRAGVRAFQSGHNGFDDLSDWRAFYRTVSKRIATPTTSTTGKVDHAK